MSTVLRPYQQRLIADIEAAWASGAQNVLLQLATGGGKTVTFADIIRRHRGSSCAIAHRNELVSQMSLTLARNGIRHRMIAPRETIGQIVALHIQETGQSWYSANAAAGVAGVDTLVRRPSDAWLQQVSLWVIDEAHHVLATNKWGKVLALFGQARGLGVTATPVRADGRGLGRHADGLFDTMVLGPPMADLMAQGWLADYRIFCPPSDFDVTNVPVSDTTGDFNPDALRKAAARSHIVGDVVESYKRIADGKLGVTFAVSVELAAETAKRFQAAGVPAECVSADTPISVRASILRRFAAREILQLVNVDLFGEGFDLPSLEVVCMARPTQSYGLYAQQFGRGLRPPGTAIVIDHVSNVLRHGLPDAPRVWSLDRRDRRTRSAPVPTVRVCPGCTGVYERFRTACPYCGWCPEPVSRAVPAHVDGDLHELDPAVLAALRGQIERPLLLPFGATAEVKGAQQKHHRERGQALAGLRDAIAWWAGYQGALGRDEREAYRLFWMAFGTDVLSAQTGTARDMSELAARVSASVPEGVRAA